jgi:hypothetical protein
MILIAAMYVTQGMLTSINWYLSWLAYIKYGGSSQAVALVYATEDTPLTELNLLAATELLKPIKVGIADSIMVYILT